MPSGVYPRTEGHRAQIQKWAAKGHSKSVRIKAIRSLKVSGAKPEFKQRMSEIVTKLSPKTKKRRIAGLKKWIKENGSTWKGGNGQEPVLIVRQAEPILKESGFIREFPILTKEHTTGHSVPTCYKVDFGNPEKKIAIEFDGPCHRCNVKRVQDQKEIKDRKKTEVLESLGWKVIRTSHE